MVQICIEWFCLEEVKSELPVSYIDVNAEEQLWEWMQI